MVTKYGMRITMAKHIFKAGLKKAVIHTITQVLDTVGNIIDFMSDQFEAVWESAFFMLPERLRKIFWDDKYPNIRLAFCLL